MSKCKGLIIVSGIWSIPYKLELLVAVIDKILPPGEYKAKFGTYTSFMPIDLETYTI